MKARTLLCAAVAIATPQIAHAERPADRAWLNVGAFLAHIDSDLRLDNETLGIEGSRVDFERDLGLKHRAVMPKASAGIRIGKAFRVEGDFFQLKRDNEIVLQRSLSIDDTVFPLAATVDSSFRTNIYRVAAGYSFVRQENAELGIAVGAHLTSAKFRIHAAGPLGITLEEHRSKSAPLPNVGLYGTVKLAGPLSLQGNVDAFKMKYGHYKGELFDGQLAVNYRFAEHFGAGVGYRYAHYKVTGTTHSWHGVLSYDYSGPLAFLELAL
jgi:hypothetical protein